MHINFEKKTRFWIGLLILAMSALYVLVSFGKTDWVKWMAVIWGIFLTVFLILEAGIVDYFRQKKYQQIGVNDLLVWVTMIVSACVLLNTILIINMIPAKSIPVWLSTFSTTTSIVVGCLAGVLGIFYTLTGKPKA